MPEILLDDETLPLWVRIEECMRMLDVALAEAKRRGAEMVLSEARYYTAKADESMELLSAGYANTFIQTVIKGRPRVSEAMAKYHADEVEYKNACEAIQVFKKKLDTMREEYAREWGKERQ